MAWLISKAMMKVCENSPFLQERVAEYLAENLLDGEQSVPSNGTPTQQAFLWQGKTMLAWKRFPSGMMCKHLTENLGEDLLMWFLEVFLVRTYHQQEMEQELMENEAECGNIWRELSVMFDLNTSSWKTRHCLLNEDLPWFSVTLPKWGMMHDGVLLERTTLVLPIKGTGSGSWEATYPTPNTLDSAGSARMNPNGNIKKWGGINSLGGMAATGYWPTPQAGDSKATINTTTQKQKMLAHAVQKKVGDGGQLNPNWTEWLMGWPVGWTDLNQLATDKWQAWLRSHGEFFHKNK